MILDVARCYLWLFTLYIDIKIDKIFYFDFDIVNFPSLDGDVPRSASNGVYISQLIRFARVSSHVDDLNTRNQLLQLCTDRTALSDL